MSTNIAKIIISHSNDGARQAGSWFNIKILQSRRGNGCDIVLSLQWEFLYWYDRIFRLNQPYDLVLYWGWHIEAETKWLQFRRRQFQMHFLEWQCMNYDYNFTEVCS